MIKFNPFLISIILTFCIYSCTNNDEIIKSDIEIPSDSLSLGSGVFKYNYNATGINKDLDIYYFIPQNKTAITPILFVFHGTQRNAKDYRNAMLDKAEQYGFIIIAPEFSEQNFLGGDGYNLGNVFVDGDNPSITNLNPEEQWTFSVIEPLFSYVKEKTNNTNNTYNIFGHSAGGQFAHRFIMFKPNARVKKIVASASGWYTFPDNKIKFPYGFKESPLETMSLENIFSKQVYLQVGENDDNPNAAGLRHNEFADAQGLNRKERAINFYQYCEELSQYRNIPFNWNFNTINNTDHNYILASESAANLLFN